MPKFQPCPVLALQGSVLQHLRRSQALGMTRPFPWLFPAGVTVPSPSSCCCLGCSVPLRNLSRGSSSSALGGKAEAENLLWTPGVSAAVLWQQEFTSSCSPLCCSSSPELSLLPSDVVTSLSEPPSPAWPCLISCNRSLPSHPLQTLYLPPGCSSSPFPPCDALPRAL